MKKRTIAQGAILLAVCSIAAKLLGGAYRIALTYVLGAEGIGYYQLVFPLFALLLAITSNAIPLTLSRQISAELSRDRGGAVRAIIKKAVLYAVFAGALGAIVTVLLSKVMASAQSQASVYICYVAIAPAIIFVALAGVFKGWFLGHGNTSPSGVSQIVEVFVKFALGLLFAYLMMPRGLMQAVAGALVAVSVSEFISLLTVFIWFMVSAKDERALPVLSTEYKFFPTFLPITASGFIFPLIAFIDSVMVVNLLIKGGASDAVSQYGILTGPVASVINMPIVLAMSISVAIVPAVASAMAGYDVVSVKQKTATTLKMCFMIAMPFFLGGAIMSRQVVGVLYPSLGQAHKDLTAYLLSLTAINVLLLSMLEAVNAILQGLGRLRPVLVNIAVSGAIKILIELIFVPRWGIMVSGVSSIVFYLTAFALNGVYYNKLVGKNAKLFKSISKITLSGAIMSMAMLPSLFIRNNIWSLVCAVGVGATVYIVSLLVMRAVEQKEMQMLPLGGKLTRLLTKTGYYKVSH
ncbi:MAG: oligosaccharide flippase family protein [Clostridia bacterium]|nr:oligosaccharide flippase family protein [Clostridia bacterium]